jgi:chromosomal replication initiation ATPase DnaA
MEQGMSLQEELHRARKERLLRMSQPRKVEVKPEPISTPVTEFDTIEAWIKRQKAIPLPAPREPSFSLIEDFDQHCATIGKVIFAVAQHFKISTQDLKSPSRVAALAYARQIGFYLSRELTKKSFPHIGERFGGRDHTTVLHGYRKIEQAMKTDWTVAYDIAHAELLV